MKSVVLTFCVATVGLLNASEKDLLPTHDSYSDKLYNLVDKSLLNPGKNLKDPKNPLYYKNTIDELQKKPTERRAEVQYKASFTAMANRSAEAIKFLAQCMDDQKTDEVITVLRYNEVILPAYMIETAKQYLAEKQQDIGQIVAQQKK